MIITGFALGIATALAPVQATAQAPRPAADSVLVSTGWLAERLNQPELVILFVGSKTEYDNGHLPGARHLPTSAFTTTRDAGGGVSLSTELPPIAALDSVLESAGISDGSRIVIYGGAVTGAARLYMTLDYLGLGARASVLDGGLPAWRSENRPLSTDVVSAPRGSLTLTPRADVVADLAAVRAASTGTGVTILDARAPEFYSGASAGQMPRAGHIPGAMNIPYTTLVTQGSSFKELAAFRELFLAAGVKPGDRVITYCHIGLQASVLYLAARAAGLDARMYDGSFDEWSRRAELPVAR